LTCVLFSFLMHRDPSRRRIPAPIEGYEKITQSTTQTQDDDILSQHNIASEDQCKITMM
jgi:hypothetical protein